MVGCGTWESWAILGCRCLTINIINPAMMPSATTALIVIPIITLFDNFALGLAMILVTVGGATLVAVDGVVEAEVLFSPEGEMWVVVVFTGGDVLPLRVLPALMSLSGKPLEVVIGEVSSTGGLLLSLGDSASPLGSPGSVEVTSFDASWYAARVSLPPPLFCG